jgi:2-succinyl-5-enolpyruvyl-6-hydroxy-3-cyclohexene-1-carboxylate synthase
MMTIRPSSSPASDFCVALLRGLASRGVGDVVLSPGSRSQALALAAAEFERVGLLRLRVRIDERVAGFVALGLAVETSLPVVVIVTSGTAVANLHPAVLEAHHSGVPLIVITADRPAELRGVGANQTTMQTAIFGDACQATFEIEAPSGAPGESSSADHLAGQLMAAALGSSGASPRRAGPVHLNLALVEPLSARVELDDASAPLAVAAAATAAPDTRPATNSTELVYAAGTVVVAGHGASEQAEAIARALGAPLLAEVSSGAHFGPNLVVAYRELLRRANFGDRVERVIVFGHPTLSREIPALIERPGVTTIVVRSGLFDDFNPGHRVSQFADAVHVTELPNRSEASRSWVGRWVTTSRAELEQHDAPAIDLAISGEPRAQAAFSRAVLAGLRAPVSRRALVEAVWRMTWPHDRLVLGASRLIREADKFVPGKKISVHANRGLAGIDGTIATAVGIALASQSTTDAAAAGVTRVLLGDLAFLHDAGALLFGLGEPRPRMQVVVGNDDGGTIFDSLEIAQVADSAAFDRVQLTTQLASVEFLAHGYGWEYVCVTTRGELDAALTSTELPTVIEVRLAR